MDPELTPEAIVLLNAMAAQFSNGAPSAAYTELNQQIVGAGQQFQQKVNRAADKTSGNLAQFRNEMTNVIVSSFNKAGQVASNTQGDIRTSTQLIAGDVLAQTALKPIGVAEENFRTMQAITTAGTLFGSIGEQLITGAQLNLSQTEMAAFGQQVEELRASGLLSAEALQQLVQIRNAFEQTDTTKGLTLGLEGAKALGIELNRLAALQLQFQDLYGPSMQKRVDDFAVAMNENIQNQNMLAQTTGMSVEAQIAATNQIMKTPGALARQMDLITKPEMTRNLVRFANTVAAIGASDLAEGFISGVGIPTPGNEIEAALKPQTTALLAMRASMEAQGASQAEIRRMDERIAETYARESQGVMQELGRVAPFLGSEFAFLQRDVNRQRATMLGQAANPNFVSDQREDAVKAITARLEDGLIKAITSTQVNLAGISEDLRKTTANALDAKIFTDATDALTALTNAANGVTTGISNIAIGQANIERLVANIETIETQIGEGRGTELGLSKEQEQEFLQYGEKLKGLAETNSPAFFEALYSDNFGPYANFGALLDAQTAITQGQQTPQEEGPPVAPGETTLQDQFFQDLRDAFFSLIGLQRETNTKLDQLTGATVTSGAQQARATEQVGVTGQMAGVNGGN